METSPLTHPILCRLGPKTETLTDPVRTGFVSRPYDFTRHVWIVFVLGFNSGTSGNRGEAVEYAPANRRASGPVGSDRGMGGDQADQFWSSQLNAG